MGNRDGGFAACRGVPGGVGSPAQVIVVIISADGLDGLPLPLAVADLFEIITGLEWQADFIGEWLRGHLCALKGTRIDRPPGEGVIGVGERLRHCFPFVGEFRVQAGTAEGVGATEGRLSMP